jgi:hypothetical protein
MAATGDCVFEWIWYGGRVPLIDQIADPLQVVATAVTPVVMVSATAILAAGVNTRYISISDRVRALAREYRETGTSADRRSSIRLQMVIFHRRLRLVSWAARVLYAAAGCFIAVALLISISLSRQTPAGATLLMFLFGLSLTAIAIILQLLELQQSNRTIDIESADVLRDSQKGNSATSIRKI